MSESEQDLQRRELIFRVLDDLQAKGERINADKIARLAKMGKQTILPYYKEWRYLDDVDREQQEELPEDLVRILKRGIAQWKHALAQQAQAFEEQANVEIDELKQTVTKLLDDQAINNKQQSELEDNLSKTAKQLAEQTTINHEKDREIAGLSAQVSALEERNTEAQALIAQQKKEHLIYTQQLEKKLDARHQEQLDHWITVVDNERRQKQELDKKLAQSHEQQLVIEKEKSELSNRLDAKNRVYMDACEDRNQLKAGYKALKSKADLVEKCMLLLDCESEDISARVREMQSAELKCHHSETRLSESLDTISKLRHSLEKAESKLEQLTSLEIQLEKARSYAEALKTRIPASDQLSDKS